MSSFLRSELAGGDRSRRVEKSEVVALSEDEKKQWEQWSTALVAVTSLPEITSLINALPFPMSIEVANQPFSFDDVPLSPDTWDQAQRSGLKDSVAVHQSPLLDAFQRFWLETVVKYSADHVPDAAWQKRDLERFRQMSKLLESLQRVEQPLTTFDHAAHRSQNVSTAGVEYVMQQREPLDTLDPYDTLLQSLLVLRTKNKDGFSHPDTVVQALFTSLPEGLPPQFSEEAVLTQWLVTLAQDAPQVIERLSHVFAAPEQTRAAAPSAVDEMVENAQAQKIREAITWFWNQHQTAVVDLTVRNGESWVAKLQTQADGQKFTRLLRANAQVLSQALEPVFIGTDGIQMADTFANFLDTLRDHIHADLEPLLRDQAWKRSTQEAIIQLSELGPAGSSEQLHISWLNRQMLDFQTWVRRDCEDPFVLEVLASGQLPRFLRLDSSNSNNTQEPDDNPVAIFMKEKLSDPKWVRCIELVRLAGFAALSSHDEVNQAVKDISGKPLSNSEYRSLGSLASAFNQDKPLAQLAQKRLEQLQAE